MKIHSVILAFVLAPFAIMAQDSVSNPLFSQSGPNVIGTSHWEWTNQGNYNVTLLQKDDLQKYNSKYITSGLRIGLAHNLDATVSAQVSEGIQLNFFALSAGLKMLLYKGNKYLPRIAFKCSLNGTGSLNKMFDSEYGIMSSTMGFIFRNHIGKRFAIDYSAQMSITKYDYLLGGNNFQKNVWFMTEFGTIHMTLYVRWLTTEHLMLSLGMENLAPKVSVAYQPIDKLMFFADAHFSHPYYTPYDGQYTYFGASFGFSCLLR